MLTVILVPGQEGERVLTCATRLLLGEKNKAGVAMCMNSGRLFRLSNFFFAFCCEAASLVVKLHEILLPLKLKPVLLVKSTPEFQGSSCTQQYWFSSILLHSLAAGQHSWSCNCFRENVFEVEIRFLIAHKALIK